ncbi:MAG: hypothetical protein H7287_08120 [Thermoleophilia bacterium]|nr:hypothetical protein [Thermoleophilia bacterium]
MPAVSITMPTRVTRAYACGVVVAAFLTGIYMSASPTSSANAAGATITITTIIPSQTSIDVTGCSASNAFDFGFVQPGSSLVTANDCTVGFGSTNGSSSLQIAQVDGAGGAMYRTTTGLPDVTFGAGGSSTHSLSITDQVWGSAVSPDESTLIVTSKSEGANFADLHMIRITPSGTLDTTYNAGAGSLRLPLLAVTGTTRGVAGVTPLADGKVLVTGTSSVQSYMAVARVNADGTLDLTFGGGDGVATFDPGGFTNASMAYKVVVLASGKLLLAGYGNTPSAIAVVARFNADGTPDMTFGGGDAFYELDLNGTTGQAFITATELVDGRIIVGGGSVTVTGAFTALRLTASGALDPSFGTAGIWRPSYGTGGFWDDIEIEPTGTILIHGSAIPSFNTRLVRLAANGSAPVPTLAGTGLITSTPVATSQSGHSIGLDADGSILVGGSSSSSNGDSIVRRYRADGTLDTAFGTGGTGTYPITTGGDEVTSIFPLANGGWRTVGNATQGATTDVWVGSFRRAVHPDYDDAGNVDWSTVGASFFGACVASVTSALADWTTNATCPASDGLYWRGVPTAATTIAHTTGVGTGSAALRFGLRTATTLAPGRLMAPVRFTVIGP